MRAPGVRARVIVASLLVAVCLGCGDEESPARPPTTGSVEGSIIELPGSTPVADAHVLLVNPWTFTPLSNLTQTDANGRYRFDQIAPGRYAIFTYHERLLAFDRTASLIYVRAGEVSTHQIRLIANDFWDSPSYRVAGTVVDADTGEPVGGAFVEGIFFAFDDIDRPFREVTGPWYAVTYDSGRFLIRVGTLTTEAGIPYGLEPISVAAAGYEPRTLAGDGPPIYEFPPALPLPPEGDSTLTVQVRLNRLDAFGEGPHGSGTIRGLVTCMGEPVAYVAVAVSLVACAEADTFPATPLDVAVPVPERTKLTDAQGAFVIDRLRPGTYALHPAYLDGDGYLSPSSRTAVVKVEESDTTDAPALEVLQGIAPIHPPDRSAIADRRPEFQWEAPPDASGYSFGRYTLRIRIGSTEWAVVENLTTPRWQMPGGLSFAPGALVRWSVSCLGIPDAESQLRRIAQFEHEASFTVGQ